MKPIERVAAAIRHEEPDRVPVYPLMNGVARHLVGASYAQWATDAATCAEAYLRVTEELDLDVFCTLIDLSVEAADFGQKLDYPANEAAQPDPANRLIREIADYRRVQPINPRLTPRMGMHIELCDRLVRAKGKEIPVVAFVFGPLGITSMLRGQAEMFLDLLDDPDAVKQCLQAVNETLLAYCDALMEAGVHAIMLDTLYASRTIMSKEMWREFEAPFVKELAEHIHARGCMVMVHNCGGGIYFDAQIEAMHPEAISFLHIPDDCQSYAEAKAKYGEQTTLIGCVPPTWLPTATPAQVEAECRKEIDTFARGGGYILATGCEYPANLSLDNARAMVRVAKEYGRY